MATTPFTSLSAGTSTASADVLAFVDVSDTSQSPQGSTLKITMADFFGTVPVPVVVTASSANALAVGQNGATNPALLVDTSTASSATGLKVTSAAAGAGVALVVISSGTDENLTLNAKGAGTIGIGSVSTGRVTITPATTITGALTQTGLATFNGGATVASGQTLTVTGATITGLTAASVGAGTFASGNFTFQGTLTVGTGVTISAGGIMVNAGDATFGGNVVLATGKTLKGTNGATTEAIIALQSTGEIQIGPGDNTNVKIGQGAASTLSPGLSGRDGALIIDSTNSRLCYYVNGARYYLAGTAF